MRGQVHKNLGRTPPIPKQPKSKFRVSRFPSPPFDFFTPEKRKHKKRTRNLRNPRPLQRRPSSLLVSLLPHLNQTINSSSSLVRVTISKPLYAAFSILCFCLYVCIYTTPTTRRERNKERDGRTEEAQLEQRPRRRFGASDQFLHGRGRHFQIWFPAPIQFSFPPIP